MKVTLQSFFRAIHTVYKHKWSSGTHHHVSGNVEVGDGGGEVEHGSGPQRSECAARLTQEVKVFPKRGEGHQKEAMLSLGLMVTLKNGDQLLRLVTLHWNQIHTQHNIASILILISFPFLSPSVLFNLSCFLLSVMNTNHWALYQSLSLRNLSTLLRRSQEMEQTTLLWRRQTLHTHSHRHRHTLTLSLSLSHTHTHTQTHTTGFTSLPVKTDTYHDLIPFSLFLQLQPVFHCTEHWLSYLAELMKEFQIKSKLPDNHGVYHVYASASFSIRIMNFIKWGCCICSLLYHF